MDLIRAPRMLCHSVIVLLFQRFFFCFYSLGEDDAVMTNKHF